MIIGLGFRARVGKDTAADYFCKEHNFQKIAFADSLKQACAIIFGLNYDQLHGDLKEEKDVFWNMSPRHILQRVGTECFRNNFHKDIWVNSLKRKIKSYPRGTNLVISDVRFPNEATAIKKWEGILVKVDRSVNTIPSDHASENSLNNVHCWDYTIHNDKNKRDLYKKIDNLIKYL